MSHIHDPEGRRLPIKVDSTSNGEFAPVPLDRLSEYANALAQERVGEAARYLGMGRRDFLVTARGAACTLLAFNAARAAAGNGAGFYDLAPESALEEELARAVVHGDELVFDVQGHFVNPTGAWLEGVPDGAKPFSGIQAASCALSSEPGERSYLRCLGPDAFVQDVFMDSDTEFMVLSFVPSARSSEPLTIEEAAATRELVANLEGSKRLFLHGRVNPNQPGDIEDMRRLRDDFGIVAWKTYTQWGPEGKGFALDDPDTGLRFLEEARALGVRRIAVHKGLPFGRQSYEHSLCDDVGRAARAFPDLNFLIYHSGFVAGQTEGPYDPERNEGVDSLVKTVIDNELGHGSNVYAELGSTWRYLMRDPDAAAHTLGKLMKYLGEDNVLWGTDSIWYGSPQDQIQAFRAFQIDAKVAEQYGYPILTAARKRKILGENALRVYEVAPTMMADLKADRVATARARYREQPDPHFRTYGPRSRREFLNFARWSGGGP